jgi:cysteine desulfurase
MIRSVYLDYHATTPVDPRVLDAMLPFLREEFGNAASRTHAFGWRAQEAVEAARKHVAGIIGASPREVVFTSGATEANNLALLGALRYLRRRASPNATLGIVTSAIEHPSVLDPCAHLEQREGVAVTRVPPDRFGFVGAGDIARAIDERTVLVSVLAANNEVGTLAPLEEIGRVAKAGGRKVLFHTDAAQAVGKVPLDVRRMGIDLLSISGHKLYAPKGIGALYVRGHDPRVSLEPIVFGGGHERGLRSGTVNVAGAVALGEACRIAGEELETEARRVRRLRDRLERALVDRFEGVTLNGHPEARLPGNLNLSFAAVEGEALIMALRTVAVSSGSACTSATPRPSHVLRALGVPPDLAHASLRFGLGRFTSEEDIDHAIDAVTAALTRLREISAAARSGWRSAAGDEPAP